MKDREKVILEMDSSFTDTGAKSTKMKLEFRFDYISMVDFMNNVRKILGKITFLDVKKRSEKHGNKAKMITITLDLEIPEQFSWNEHEKSCMQPRRNLPFSITRCVFGRRMTIRSNDVMRKYLSVTIKVSDSDNNLVLAVVHAVSTFSLRNLGSSLPSLASGSLMSLTRNTTPIQAQLPLEENEQQENDVEPALAVRQQQAPDAASYFFQSGDSDHEQQPNVRRAQSFS